MHELAQAVSNIVNGFAKANIRNEKLFDHLALVAMQLPMNSFSGQVCSRMLAYAHVCETVGAPRACRYAAPHEHLLGPGITYADVCGRMLSYAVVCESVGAPRALVYEKLRSAPSRGSCHLSYLCSYHL
jgi:hypothetical protein